jgi:4-amino-4-deoxy-L-arabinose transferase-like glycosyltransferase
MGDIWDRLALVLCFGVILVAALVGSTIFENVPHLEDEFAYLWQARVMAEGKISLATPSFPKSFLVPFVVDYQGLRFGKYPPGWPAILSLGVRAGLTAWVNPLLAGLAVWLTYRLGKRTLGEKTGFLGAGLVASSPLFLIQAGSLLSHIWSLVLTLAFIYLWLISSEKEDNKGGVLPTVTAGVSLGLLVSTRPLTALAVAFPFFISGIFQLITGPAWKRKRVLLIGGIVLILSLLYPIWQWSVTGSYSTNPYTLWWEYDKFGFGEGFGVTETGHSLLQGWRNTRHSLRAAASDMFGWPGISWIFLPFGLWAARKTRLLPFAAGISISLVVLYLGYWVGSWLLGSRYYFEALPGLALLSAAGVGWLAGWDSSQRMVIRKDLSRVPVRLLLTSIGLSLLIFGNLYYYLPTRLGSLRGLYGIERSDLEPFETAVVEEYQPALVIVDSEQWMPYGSLLVLESPRLDSGLIFAWSMGIRTDQRLAEYYRDTRNILYYYPDQYPLRLFTHPQNSSLIE